MPSEGEGIEIPERGSPLEQLVAGLHIGAWGAVLLEQQRLVGGSRQRCPVT